jgi:hypothetical protein
MSYDPLIDWTETVRHSTANQCQPEGAVPGASQPDVVHHPAHYNWHPAAECITVAAEFSYNLGTVIAYIWRAGRKTPDPLPDLRKAREHLDHEIHRLEKKL